MAQPHTRRKRNRRLCAHGAGLRFGCRQYSDHSRTRGWWLPARWREDLHLQRGIADIYVLFARTGEAPGAKGLSAFLVPAATAGFEVVERIDVMAPHPSPG